MESRELFHARRLEGLGGSDMASVLGISRWKTRYALWEEKRGKAPDDPSEDKPWLERGRELEPLARWVFEKQTGLRTEGVGDFVKHPEHPELIGNLDGLTTDADGVDCVVEFKTSTEGKSAWTGTMPEHVRVQVQHYMLVTGRRRAWVGVICGAGKELDLLCVLKRISPEAAMEECGKRLLVLKVERDEGMVEKIRQRGVEFWARYVKGGESPPLERSEEADLRWPSSGDCEVEGHGDVLRWISDLEECHRHMAALAEEKDRLEVRIKAFMGAARACTHGGNVLVRWGQHTMRTLDAKAVREMAPDVARMCEREKTMRRFTVCKRQDTGEERVP